MPRGDLAAASLLLGHEVNGNTARLSPWRESGTGEADGGERRERCGGLWAMPRGKRRPGLRRMARSSS